MSLWDILICSVVKRTDDLCSLLAYLSEQIVDGVTVTVCLDNCELSYPAKSQKLLDNASSLYVSFIDDDDTVAPDYIPEIMSILAVHRLKFGVFPDYVGYNVLYTKDGEQVLPVQHSLHYKGWNVIDEDPEVLTRDIVQFNPIKRELALLGKWEDPGWQADWRWANQVRASGQVKTQAFIPAMMYHKRDRTGSDFRDGHTARSARPAEGWASDSRLPRYPWLRWI